MVSPVKDLEPDFWRNLRDQLSASRAWVDRAIVLAYAVATGLVVVVFTLLSEAATQAFESLRSAESWTPYAMLLWTPALTVVVLWLTRRYAPGALGSGIPQVVRALDDTLPQHQRQWLVSLRVALAKVGLVSGGMLAGLSIGREGPTVQVGAGVMVHARRWLSPGSGIDAHALMVAGAAAGIAAAFNTPLGGIIFALEQLSRRRGMSHSALMIVSIVIAGLVAVAVFGNVTYFGRLRVPALDWSLLGPGLLVALVAGLAGGLFTRLLVASVRGTPDVFSHWRRHHPLRFAAGAALGVAVIGLVTGGATAGAGYAPTRALLDGAAAPGAEAALSLPGLYTLLKFCATWLSAWTGVPTGTFAPSLSIGAGIGADIARLTGVSSEMAIPLIALGMVGFLSATTQGPITAFIIVMEMVAGHTMVLSLMACSLLASGVARLISRPLYGELAALLVLPPDPAAEKDPCTTTSNTSHSQGRPDPQDTEDRPQSPSPDAGPGATSASSSPR